MARLKSESYLKSSLEDMKQRINFLENEIKIVKTWLLDDTIPTPSERILINRALNDIKTGKYKKLISHEELRKKLAV
ncbi:MAG: hypothetical protein HYW24_03445 [Candidatus Aenigmarchaeota archaeon]|nr:hypothetical protein [Candidatus Aenigmarchaeota archaeon]